ncbi:MAG: hypothetical protein E7381_03360 [Clostridiales bacterium]|nr:hypothetical protein [Clostridiales bacterium]
MTKKKKLILALAAFFSVVAIVAISVLGTIAYLTSSSTVTNTFTIGNVSITMTESKVNTDGEIIKDDNGNATQVISNTYTLMPGVTYTKDPKITVSAGSSESYLFVMVRNDIKAIEEVTGADYKTMHDQMLDNGWKEHTTTSTSTVYVYCGEKGVKIHEDDVEGDPTGVGGASEVTIPVFECFKIQSQVENLPKYNSATIVLRAFAVQTSGFVDDGTQTAEQKAWIALTEEYGFIHTT